MSRIKGKDTKPELIIRKFLFSRGFRFRLHVTSLPGKPDIVLAKHRSVVFVHGCFWHGHSGCRYFVVPKTRTEWWLQKIEKNTFNDSRAVAKLEKAGWKVITIWECELKSGKLSETLAKLPGKITADINP